MYMLHYYRETAHAALPYFKGRPVTLRFFPKVSLENRTTCARVLEMLAQLFLYRKLIFVSYK